MRGWLTSLHHWKMLRLVYSSGADSLTPKMGDVATFFRLLHTESFRVDSDLSETEQLLLQGPLSWDIVLEDVPKPINELEMIPYVEVRNESKNVQETEFLLEQSPKRRRRATRTASSRNDSDAEEREDQSIVLLRKISVRVYKLEKSMKDIKSSITDVKTSISNFVTYVDEVKKYACVEN